MLKTINGKFQIIFDCIIKLQFRKVEIRHGLCSKNYETDMHILLWDFDNDILESVIHELKRLQNKYLLPDIYILESSENHYHAYSFTARNLQEIIHILSDTKSIDIDYLRLGMARGYYTLRYSPKMNNRICIIGVLPSNVNYEMSPLDVTINEYYTTNI